METGANRTLSCTLGVMFSLGILAAPAAADRIWWDGSRDDGAGPPGKLLSDNEGYWGDCVLTGVE